MAIRKPVPPIDVQLAALAARKADLVDQLVHCLVEIDTLSIRADVLLDRKTNPETPAERTQEMPAVRPDADPA